MNSKALARRDRQVAMTPRHAASELDTCFFPSILAHLRSSKSASATIIYI